MYRILWSIEGEQLTSCTVSSVAQEAQIAESEGKQHPHAIPGCGSASNGTNLFQPFPYLPASLLGIVLGSPAVTMFD